MDIIALSAQERAAGKKGARATRRMGDVPCVLYGHHVDPISFKVTEKSLNPLIYTNETHLVQISLADNSWECILKDVACHPVTDRPLHADFQVLKAGEKVTITVPVQYKGTPKGQINGGHVNYVVTELVVNCLPKNIPSQITLDVVDVDIGDSIHVADLDMEDLEFLSPDDQILMTVMRPRRVEEEVAPEEETEGITEEEPEE